MCRVWIVGLCACLLLATAEAGVGQSPNCGSTEECLLYKVICGNDDYEVRHYDPVTLVSTDVECLTIDMSSFKGFRRLFKYITGENEEEKEIDMTAPVIVRTERKWYSGNTKDTVSFVLPSAEQKNPPKPSNNEVYTHNMTGATMYVAKYSGWMTFYSEKRESDKFCKMLDSVGASYEKDFRFAAVYNSPMDWFNRRNEVWFLAKGRPVCPPRM